MDISYFTTPKGKLNPNWKTLLKRDPTKFDRTGFSDDLDDITVLRLAMAGLKEYPTCIMCGKPASRIDSKYCGKKCSASDPEVKQKKLDKIDTVARGKKISEKLKGRNDYHEKGWDSRRESYGASGFSEDGIASIKASDRNVEKARQTCIERYGVDNGSKASHVREHLSNIMLELKPSRNHLPDWLFDKDQFIEARNRLGHYGIVDLCNCSSSFVYGLELEYDMREKHRSSAETDIMNYVKSISDANIISNTRKILPDFKELDLYIPEFKLAIEYDGIYWHSSNSPETDSILKAAHVFKTNECEKLDIHLLHIFENEWRNPVKRDIWKSVISHKLGKSKKIFARKCEIKVIELTVAHEFCEENHLQGKCGASSAKGLFYNGELVQVATFGKPRFNKSYDMELLRLCSKKYTCVVGGASKLLKGLKLISYANRRWSFGDVYEQMGMEKIRVTPPGYFYIVEGDHLKHRSGYMKHMLENKLEKFDNSLTESENCYANGLRRIWDCGNIVYHTK